MTERNGNYGLRLKTGLAEMLKGGLIMDVTGANPAEIAASAGGGAVMGLEHECAQIRATGASEHVRLIVWRRVAPLVANVPVPIFAAVGIAPPAVAPLSRYLGAAAVCVGYHFFMNDSPTSPPAAEAEQRARAIVRATTHFD